MGPKFGKKLDAISLLHDHVCHTGRPYVNGHCFVNLTLSVPALSQRERPPISRYLAVTAGHRMWPKERTKLEYAKSSLIEQVLQYPPDHHLQRPQ